MTEPVAILGGTFDPVHYGHLRPALEVCEALSLAELLMVPARVPPHRDYPGANAKHRLAMLELALAGQDRMVIDRRELDREGPSYTVETLASLREAFPDRALMLVLGEDSFASLSAWHRWQELPELAHFVVMTRPQSPSVLDAALEDLAARLRTEDPHDLRRAPCGRLLAVPVTPLVISASRIRRLVAQGRDTRWLLPDAVRDYILEQGLYRAG